MTLVHRLGHGVLKRVVSWGERGFRRNLGRLESTQQRALSTLLRSLEGSQSARAFNIHADTDWRAFAERVPVSGYADWAKQIERSRHGGDNLTDSPVVRFQPTSGSTSAIKWIPYSKRFLGELDGAIVPWLADLYRQYPRIAGGSHYWSLSWLPTDMRNSGTEDLNDDMQLLSAGKRLLAAATQAVPEQVALAPTSADAAFATLVMMAADTQLAVMSVWSPTFALTQLEQLANWREEIAECLRRGHWGARQQALGFLRCPKNRRQADLLARWHGEPSAGFFRELWPSLALVSAWDTASATRWAKVLHSYLPHAGFQGKGLWATEGVVTFPYRQRHLLAYQSHYYEFEDLDSGRIVPSWSLKVGQQVAPVISTGSGLLRYRMGDQLQVTGFLQSVPALAFLGREDGVDLVGEKLATQTAQQLLDVVAEQFAVRTVSLVALEQSSLDQRPGYVLLLEGAGKADLRAIAAFAEKKLLDHFHYRLARSLDQLNAVRVVSADDMRDYYLDQCRQRGMIEGNIKIEPLRRWDGALPARLADASVRMRAHA